VFIRHFALYKQEHAKKTTALTFHVVRPAAKSKNDGTNQYLFIGGRGEYDSPQIGPRIPPDTSSIRADMMLSEREGVRHFPTVQFGAATSMKTA